jgi:hypothetical protein
MRILIFATLLLSAHNVVAQVDQEKAATYFKEAAALCELEGGKLWGTSLCGPLAFADAATGTVATSLPAPTAPKPAYLGFVNAALDWGGTRWSTIVWPMIAPMDKPARATLMIHELFHRIQPDLGFMTVGAPNDHLDTLDGRYWIQLEWRALTKALRSSGDDRASALRDALAFRAARRNSFPGSAEKERADELREGLAQFTAIFVSASDPSAAAIDEMTKAAGNPTYLATFGYASGAAYGVLLTNYSPGWTRRLKSTDDLGDLVTATAEITASANAGAAAKNYGGDELRAAEEKRDGEQKARIAELRKRFIDGPVLILPGVRSSSSTTIGRTAIPGAGIVYPMFRTSAEWGILEAASVLIPEDRSKVIVPAPPTVEGPTVKGDGWTLTPAPGWIILPGARAGDFQLVREQ